MNPRVLLAVLLIGLVGLIGLAPDPAIAAEHADDGTPADPETDVIGWEAGYWHNETIPVDPADGFNESEVNMTVARAMARVELIRQLEFNRSVPVSILTRTEYRNQTGNWSVDPRTRQFDNAKFEALFLVGEDEDSIEIQQENRGAVDLGLYDFEADRILIVSSADGPVTLDEHTLAHELVHALQDQHFNLSRYDRRTRDGTNGLHGLLEGDPSYVEYEYRQRCADTWEGECYRPEADGIGSANTIPHIGVYAVKIQPYSDGATFVQSLRDRGDWAAVNAAYADPPVSSEQVIHPSRYPEGVPSPVTVPDRATDEWARVRPPDRPAYETMGEAALVAMLVYPLYDSPQPYGWIITPEEWFNSEGDGLSDFDPLNYDTDYTDGWDGDRFHVYENSAGETASVWRLNWETETDANEFVAGYRRVLSYWGAERVGPNTWVIRDGGFADAYRIVIRGTTVTIINAPSEEDLDTVWPPRATVSQPRAGNDTNVTSVTPELTRLPPTSTFSDPVTSRPSEPSTVPTQPGFGAALAILALILLTGVVAVRRR